MIKNIMTIAFAGLIILSACSPKDKTQNQSSEKDFTLMSLDNEEITLSKLKGNVVLVDFWATWCRPCLTSIPVFIRLYNKYHDQGFIALGISREDKTTLLNYREQIGITYPILIDDKGIDNAYGIQAIPTILFFDKKGQLRKKQVGFAPELEAQFETLVDSLLKE